MSRSKLIGKAHQQGRTRFSCLSCCGSSIVVLLLLVASVIGWYNATTMHVRVTAPPPQPLPSPNGLDDIVLAGNILHATGGSTALSVTSAGFSSIRQDENTVRANAQALSILRRALTKQCQVPSTRSYADTFPYLEQVRNLARLLSAEARVRAAHGDYVGAVESGLDGYALGIAITRGGLLIHGMVQGVIETTSQPAIVNNIDRLSAHDAERLSARMEALVRSRVSTSVILGEEKDTFEAIIAKMDASVRSGNYTTTKDLIDSDSQSGFKVMRTPLMWRLHHDAMVRQTIRYLSDMATEAAKPVAARKRVPTPTDPLALLFSPSAGHILQRFDQADARAHVIASALRIQAFRAKNGRLPATLSEAGIPADMQTDPFTGKPLIYRLHGGDYLLYSVGPDLHDNGGIPADEASLADSGPQGDFGARMFRTYTSYNPARTPYYRRVPHMLPPKLTPGAPPLNP